MDQDQSSPPKRGRGSPRGVPHKSPAERIREQARDLHHEPIAYADLEAVPMTVRKIFEETTLDLITAENAMKLLGSPHVSSFMRLIKEERIRTFNLDGFLFVSRTDCQRERESKWLSARTREQGDDSEPGVLDKRPICLTCGGTFEEMKDRVRLHIVREDAGETRALLYSARGWECKKCGSKIANDIGLQLGNYWRDGRKKFFLRIEQERSKGKMVRRVDVDKTWR